MIGTGARRGTATSFGKVGVSKSSPKFCTGLPVGLAENEAFCNGGDFNSSLVIFIDIGRLIKGSSFKNMI